MRFRNPETRAGRGVTGGAAAVASLALLASGCGSSHEGDTNPLVRGNEPALTFDDLGGGSSVIEVFPAPGAKAADGTYFDGDKVDAICKTEGPERASDPGVGEAARQSDEWIKIAGTPGENQFATAVYIEHPEQVLNQLPEC